MDINDSAFWSNGLEVAIHNLYNLVVKSPSNNKLAVFGDSITQQNSNVSSGNENYGYATWACQLSRQRFQFSPEYNFGVGGDTTTMMLSRIGSVIDSDAGTVVVLGGTNDRGSADMTLQETISNLTAIRDKLLNTGKLVIFVAPLPRGDTTYTDKRLSGVQLANHLQVRQWVLSQSSVRGVRVVDPWPTMAVQSSTTGDIIVGLTSDGLHPNTRGAFSLGKAISNVLIELLPDAPLLPASNTDQYSTDNLVGCVNLNPMFTGTAGTPSTGGSGQLADSWSGTNATGTTAVTRTYSKVTTNGKDWQQVVIGGGPTTGEAAIDIARQIGLQAKAIPGSYLQAAIEYEVDASSSNVMSLQLGVTVTSSQGTVTLWDGDRYTGASVLPSEAFSGVMLTPKVLIPADATDVRLRLSCYLVNGTSPAATIRFRAASLRNLG